MEKQGRIIEITPGQIWGACLLIILISTTVFMIGIRTGKRKISTQHHGAYQQIDTGKRTAKYTIQVASFSSYNLAENLSNVLIYQGYISWVRSESSSITGEMIYNVLVGRFDTREMAARSGQALRGGSSDINEYIVRDLQPYEME